MKNLIFVDNPIVRDFCRDLKIEEFSGQNLYDNQLECITLFNLDQLKKPHENFKHYFDNHQINEANFFLFWKEEDLEIIKNSLLENTLNDMKITLNDYSKLLKKSAYKKNFDFNEIRRSFIYMNSQNFKITIESRSYNVLLPFFDIYDMVPKTNVDWSSQLSSFNDTVKLFAVNDIHKDDPIITNYGDMDNSNLLINFGFTLENNTFPIETEFFIFNYEGNEYSVFLRQNDTKDIFETVNKIKIDLMSNKKYNSKGHLSFDDPKKDDLKIFHEMLKQLSVLSNKKRLENLLNNLYDSPNAINIYRALQAEDILIDENLQNLAEIIKILNGKTEIDVKLQERKIYKENKFYFDRLLGKHIEHKSKKSILNKKNKIVINYNSIL